jgi:acid-sensing ion channel, other
LKKDHLYKRVEICRSPSFVVHSPFEFPNVFEDMNFCQSDYAKSLDVLITPQVIVTDEDLIDVAPSKRGCFFDGERELKFYRVYTKLNCEVECYADFLHKAINCTPYYLARVDSLKLCDLDDIKFIIAAGSLNDTHKCNCLERCNSVNYEIEIFQNGLTSTNNT